MTRWTPLDIAVFALLTLVWGTTWAAIRIGLQGLPPLTGVALRFGIAAAALFPIALARRVRFGRTRRERILWIANALATFVISYVVVYWAEQWVPSGLAALIFSTYPLFVALQAHVAIPGEQLTLRGLSGVLAGFAGVAVLFSGDLTDLGGRQVAVAGLVLLLSPFFSALGSVLVKRWGGDVHPLSLTIVPMALAAALVGGLAAVFERGRPLVLDPVSVAALLYLALAGSALTFTPWFWLLARVEATRVSMIAYTVPVVAVVVGILFLDEPFTWRVGAGAMLVLLGTGLVLRQRRSPLPAAETFHEG